MSKALALKVTIQTPPNGKPPLIECAKAFLPRLQSAPASDLDTLSRKTLARSLGLGESTLYKYVNALTAEGLIHGDWTQPLSVRIASSRRDTFLSIVPPAETVSEETAPTGDTFSSIDSPAETLSGVEDTSPRLLPNSSIIPTAETVTEQKDAKKEKNQKKETLSFSQRTAEAGVQTSLKLPSGTVYTTRSLTLACMNDRVTEADWAELQQLKRRPTQEAYWKAILVGTGAAVKRQYKQLWAATNGTPGKAASDLLDAPKNNKHWLNATEAVITAGLGVSEYLRRAQDNCGKKFKVIPLAFLGASTTLQQVVAWMSPEEKHNKWSEQNERDQYGGLTLEEIHERTRRAGV